jgi:hypothetical protein
MKTSLILVACLVCATSFAQDKASPSETFAMATNKYVIANGKLAWRSQCRVVKGLIHAKNVEAIDEQSVKMGKGLQIDLARIVGHPTANAKKTYKSSGKFAIVIGVTSEKYVGDYVELRGLLAEKKTLGGDSIYYPVTELTLEDWKRLAPTVTP